MKRVIPLVCAVNQKMGGAGGGVDDAFTPHTNGMHYALVETDHPYKAPGVNLFKVRTHTDSMHYTQAHTDTDTHTHTHAHKHTHVS